MKYGIAEYHFVQVLACFALNLIAHPGTILSDILIKI